jgi:hypothetical protein
MSAVGTTALKAGLTPRGKARMAGVLYAFEGTAAVFGGVYFRNTFLAAGDAAATAHAILANETLFRACFASALLAVAFHLAYTVLFYDLFAPVNRTISLLAAFVSLVACSLQAGAALFQFAPLLILPGMPDAGAANAVPVEQAQGLALLFLNLNALAFNIYLIFFGFWLLVSGYLIARSHFFPRLIGVLLMLDGLGWMSFLWPPFASAIYPLIAIVAAFGEIPLLLWLLVFGVNNQRWQEQASAREASISG